MHGVNPIVLRRLSCLKVYRIYATAQLTPSAVPTAARLRGLPPSAKLINTESQSHGVFKFSVSSENLKYKLSVSSENLKYKLSVSVSSYPRHV